MKKKPDVETEMRSLLPEEVQECAQKLAGLVVKRRHLKAKAKADAKAIKADIEEVEEEIERLSQVVITQQEEVPMQRQMTLAEIEDQRRHELSIGEFNRETNVFDLGKPEDAAPVADPIAAFGDVVEAADDADELMEGERPWPYPEIRVSRELIEDGSPMDKSSSVMLIQEGKLRKPFEYEGQLWVELGSVSQNLRTISRDCYVVLRRDDYEGPVPMFYKEVDRDRGHRRIGYVGMKGVYKKQEYVIVDGPFTFLPNDEAASMASPEMASTPEPDPLDLVPDDKHGRNWSSLSDLELGEWKARLLKYQKLTGLAPDLQTENAAMLERVEATIRNRDAAWSKADAAGGD